MPRYEFSEGSSNKFWEIARAGKKLTVRWGRIGAAGSEKVYALATEAEATANYDKLVAEKTGKGYVLAGGGGSGGKPASGKPASGGGSGGKPASGGGSGGKPASGKPASGGGSGGKPASGGGSGGKPASGGGSGGKPASGKPASGKPATAKPATAGKPSAAWLADVKPTKEIAAKGRMHDVTGDPAVTIDPAEVEKHLGLPVGPVMRDFIALCQATEPGNPVEAFGPLGRYQLLTLEIFIQPAKNIGYGDRPKSLRAFASDHKNVLYLHLSGTTSDDCLVVYESIVDADPPTVVAENLATYLSQLAYQPAPDHLEAGEKNTHRRLQMNLRLLPGLTEALGTAELPEEYAELDFEAKPAKAFAAVQVAVRDNAAAASKPLVAGKAGVLSKAELAKAQKLFEKGDVFSDLSDAKKLAALKDALAIVGGAIDGEGAKLRLEVEKQLLSSYQSAEGKARKEGAELAARLLIDWAERGVTDEEGWKALSMLHRDCKIAIPEKQATRVRRAWATALLTDYIGDMQTKPKPPKDTKDAYTQARVELFHKHFERARACLPIAKRDEYWFANAECLEVELLRQEGKPAEAHALLAQLVDKHAGGPRYGEIEWGYLGAVYVMLELKDAKLAKRLVTAWNKNVNYISPTLFEL